MTATTQKRTRIRYRLGTQGQQVLDGLID